MKSVTRTLHQRATEATVKEDAKKEPAKKEKVTEISDILKVTKGRFECHIVGTSPIILNRMSEKASRQLLLPRGRLTESERSLNLKHDPIAEYRASPYTLKDASQPTLLAFKAAGFKKALINAALDIPGTRKAQIGRLTFVVGDLLPLYGIPKLGMTIVRSADMNRTPDVRTRAIVGEWACSLQIEFVQPLIKAQAVANLLAAAGITQGVGDYRPEKGAGAYGQFRLADVDDPEFQRIVRAAGRQEQADALETPVCWDDESAELLAWYDDECTRRRKEARLPEKVVA